MCIFKTIKFVWESIKWQNISYRRSRWAFRSGGSSFTRDALKTKTHSYENALQTPSLRLIFSTDCTLTVSPLSPASWTWRKTQSYSILLFYNMIHSINESNVLPHRQVIQQDLVHPISKHSVYYTAAGKIYWVIKIPQWFDILGGVKPEWNLIEHYLSFPLGMSSWKCAGQRARDKMTQTG